MKNVAKTLPQIVETATFPGQDPAFSHFGSFPLIKPRKAKSLAISRLLAFSISIVPHNVPQILGVFEVPKNQ